MLVIVALGAVVGASVGVGRETGARDALSEARRHVLDADYLAVTREGGFQVLFSDARTVIKRRDRVVSWESRRESFTLRDGRCYERYTESNRADARDMRHSAAFAGLANPRFQEGSRRELLVGEERSFDGPTVMWALRVDSRNRPLTLRSRGGYETTGYSRWSESRYEFLTRREFDKRVSEKPKETCSRRRR